MDKLLAHWSASWLVAVIYLAVVVIHLTGLRYLLAAAGRGAPAPAAGSCAGKRRYSRPGCSARWRR